MIKRGWRVLSAVLIAVLLGVWLFTAARHSVYGYTSQTVRKDTAYKDGYFYVVLQDMGGQMTRCRINMSRTELQLQSGCGNRKSSQCTAGQYGIYNDSEQCQWKIHHR